jgi:probable HAF family extracellular repeat protein
MKTSKLLTLVLALSWIAVSNGILQAAPPQYHYYTNGQGTGSQPVAINDNGQAVVNFNDRAYLWSLSGGLTDLGDLGGGKSYAYGINNLGQIVGESYIDSTSSHAFLWHGQMSDLGGLSGGVRSIAVSINNLGVIIGGTFFSDNSFSPFRWTQDNKLQSMDLQGGIAFKIIDDGRMVGSKNNHAWLWNAPGAGTDLGGLPGFGYTEADDINQSGQVVGFATPAQNVEYPTHAFSWTPNVGLKDLGTLGGPNSRAFSINNEGFIVGWADKLPYGTNGCMWTPSGDKLNLDALVVNKPAGANIGDAHAINQKGVIVGQGNDNGVPYMLVPTQIPHSSPGALLLLLQ